MTSDIQHFWSPPHPGEVILGMAKFQGVLVVATTNGVYIIAEHGRSFPDWEVQQISREYRRSLKE